MKKRIKKQGQFWVNDGFDLTYQTQYRYPKPAPRVFTLPQTLAVRWGKYHYFTLSYSRGVAIPNPPQEGVREYKARIFFYLPVPIVKYQLGRFCALCVGLGTWAVAVGIHFNPTTNKKEENGSN